MKQHYNNILFGTKILRCGYSYVHDIHIFILFTERYRKLQEDYQEAASTVQEQKLLITQLEEDLRSFNAVSSMFRGEAEGEPVTGSQVEADVVAEVVKDVIPSGFCLIEFISSLNRYNEIILKMILSYVFFSF